MGIYKKAVFLSEVIISYVSMLSIRSKSVYVFGSWRGNKFSDNPKYLYLEAVKDKSLTAIWITKNRNIYTNLKAKALKYIYIKAFQGFIIN